MRLLVVYGGTTEASDSANTAGAVVERDTNGDVFVNGVAAGPCPSSAPTLSGTFLSSTGALMLAGTVQTAAITLTAASTAIQKLNANAAPFTTTLPPSASSSNLLYFFVKTDTTGNLPTLKANGSENILAGPINANTYTGLTTYGSVVILWCDGTQWYALESGNIAHLLLNGPAPTAAAGANAGTAPPAPQVANNSCDSAGSVTFGTGTTPAAGAQVVITFNTAFAATPRAVVITPSNSATVALQPYVTSITATGFTLSLASAPAASQSNSTYGFDFAVIG